MRQFDDIPDGSAPQMRVYTLCCFPPRAAVPEVVLIDAADDDEALGEARMTRAFTTREVWDRHRLVGVIDAGF